MNRSRSQPTLWPLAAASIVALFILAGCSDAPPSSGRDDGAAEGGGAANGANSDAAGPEIFAQAPGTSQFVGTFYQNYEMDDLPTQYLQFRVPDGVNALNVTAYLEATKQGPYLHKIYSTICCGWATNNIQAPPEGDRNDLGKSVWGYAVPDMAGVAERDAQVLLGPYQAFLRDPDPGWWRFATQGEGNNLRARWDVTFEYGEHDPGIIVGITQGVANSTVEVIGPLTIPWATTLTAGDRIHQNFTIGDSASHMFAEMNAIVPREGPYYLTAKSEAERRFADVMIAQYHEETSWRKGLINPAAGNAEAPFTHEGPFNTTIENPADDTWKLVTIGMGENIQLQAMIYVTYPAPNA